jgi:hypothetical protein
MLCLPLVAQGTNPTGGQIPCNLALNASHPGTYPYIFSQARSVINITYNEEMACWLQIELLASWGITFIKLDFVGEHISTEILR